MHQLKACPGGVLASELREAMRQAGYTGFVNYQSVLAAMPDDFPIWEQTDEEGDVWLHLLRPDDVQVKRRIEVKSPDKPRKAVREDKAPQIGVSRETYRRLKHYVADHGGSLKDAVEKAVEQMVGGAK